MAKFRVTKPYTMEKDEIRDVAERLAKRLEEEHGVRSRWKGDCVQIEGSGISGEMTFHDGMIDISVKLGMLVSMFESVLKKEVKRYLDEHVS
ncbi:MAG: polyhydroxyalkanoic acid system family protein [Halioglobus sp.]|nr:polyhydroxyalkanoic acid system family protein [Halioglobus sp.]